MPTDHRRHAITETEDISDALDIAGQEWPEIADKPGALLRRLVLVGRDALAHNNIDRVDGRRQSIAQTSGALGGVFGPDYLEGLREDWPE